MRHLTADLVCGALVFCWLALFSAVTLAGPAGANAAAWVQAVGSVIAILAAIWIDQGAARRAETAIEAVRQDRLTAESDRVEEWRQALAGGRSAMLAASTETPRIAGGRGEVHPDLVETPKITRLLENGIGVLDLYLASEPPNPHLGAALVGMRTELKLAVDTVSKWRRDAVFAGTLSLDLDSHLADADAVIARYEGAA